MLLNVPVTKVVRTVGEIRSSRYAVLRNIVNLDGASQVPIETVDDQAEELKTVLLPPGAWGVGRTLDEIRERGAEVRFTSIRRHEIVGREPGGEAQLRDGDIVVIYGSPKALEHAESVLLAGGRVMHKSRLAGFIIDCNTGDLDAAATFWTQALGYKLAEVDGDPGIYRTFSTRGATGLHIEVQKVEHPSRVHLDIETDDIEAEATRLEGVGREEGPAVPALVGDGGADWAKVLRGPSTAGGLRSQRQRLGMRRLV